MSKSIRVKTVEVYIMGCRSTSPIRTFDLPDTGDVRLNCELAEKIHVAVLGPASECYSCSGGDYHFSRGVQFVGPATHAATKRSRGKNED